MGCNSLIAERTGEIDKPWYFMILSQVFTWFPLDSREPSPSTTVSSALGPWVSGNPGSRSDRTPFLFRRNLAHGNVYSSDPSLGGESRSAFKMPKGLPTVCIPGQAFAFLSIFDKNGILRSFTIF